MSALFGDSFGNYLLHGIEEIHLPEPVAWWPQTLGWKLLAAALLLFALYQLYHATHRWWRNRYRRCAIAQLDELEQSASGHYSTVLSALPALLKASALHAYPRADIAALSGEQWLGFLDRQYDGPSFRQGVGRQLLAVAYQPDSQWQLSTAEARELIQLCRLWLKKHRITDTRAADDA